MTTPLSPSLKRIEELQVKAKSNPTVENYRNLLRERLAYLEAHPNLLKEQQPSGNAIPLKNQQPNKVSVETTRDSSRVETAECEVEENYLRLYFGVLRKCAKRTALLDQYMAKPYDCPKEYIRFVGEQLDNWVALMDSIEDNLQELKQYRWSHPKVVARMPPMEDLMATVDKMCSAQLRTRSFIGHERHRHALRSDSGIEVFVDHCDSLEQWLKNGAQRVSQCVVSFRECETFLSYLFRNKNKVEDGLLALSFEGELLKLNTPNRKVRESLQKCFRLWVELTWNTYERVHQDFLDYHEDMDVAERCQTYLSSECPAIEHFLSDSVPKLLLRLRSEKSKKEEISEEVEKLLSTHEDFKVLAGHVATFKLRMAVVGRAITCLSRAVRSPLAFFLMHLPAWDEYEGRKELHQQLLDLQEWIEVHSQRQTFLNLLEQTNRMRTLVTDFKTALASASALEGENEKIQVDA